MNNKITTVAAGTLSTLSIIAYFVSHILAAIFIFKRVKLWLFLIVLLVPVLGDITAIFVLLSSKLYLPFLFYGISIALYIIGGIVARKVDG